MTPDFFVSAEWSTDTRKRAVYVADLTRCQLRHVATDTGWTLSALLAYCRRLTESGAVLIGIDAAFGVSRGFWDLVAPQPPSFLDWLRDVDPDRFFGIATDPTSWCVGRPWFRVRPVEGGRRAFTERVPDGLLRKIDRATGGNPLLRLAAYRGPLGQRHAIAGRRSPTCWQRRKGFRRHHDVNY